MKVQVLKCRFTGKLFEEKNRTKYIEHLKKIRAELKLQREYERSRLGFTDWLAGEKCKITQLDQIAPWFLENQRTIMTATNALVFCNNMDRYKAYVPEDCFISAVLGDPVYNQLLSNSHNCPAGGVTNWGSHKPDAPTGYPGWASYIKINLQRPGNRNNSYPVSETLNLIGIRTGSGGGGNSNTGYGVSIFLDDWPGLQEEIRIMEENRILQRLMGRK